jgi:hypothetical protein
MNHMQIKEKNSLMPSALNNNIHYRKLFFFQQVFIDSHLKPLIIALIIDG